jgi:hypothetical protein
MAITAIAGHSGTVTLPTGSVMRSASFNFQAAGEVNDCSGFTSTQIRENLSGMKSWGADVAGYLVHDAATTAPGFVLSGTLTMGFLSTTTQITSTTARCSSEALGMSIDGNAIGAFGYVGSGTPSFTWDES